jgi:hypothetical protein
LDTPAFSSAAKIVVSGNPDWYCVCGGRLLSVWPYDVAACMYSRLGSVAPISEQ